MAVITAEQREAEIKDREDFKKNIEAGKRRRREELRMSLSIADRLMRRTQLARFQILFQDDLGDFSIETRQMTSRERFRTTELTNLLDQSEKETKKYTEAIEGLRQLAKEITLTPGMDDYYDSDQVTDEVVLLLVLRTFRGTLKMGGDAITFFREEQRGPVLPRP